MPLTDEDKNWIRAELASLSGEIRHTTEGAIETRLASLSGEIRHTTAVAIEATETRLLTAFHQWASPMDARMRTHAAAIRALDLESEALSDRVAKLEPPH